jgi:ArsR family transcriptional regulator
MSNHSDRIQVRGTFAIDGECSASIVDAQAIERVRAAAASLATVERTTAIFSALADPTRFRILDALSHEQLCVCDLAGVCGVSQSGVSHQLRLLRERGLVAFSRDGNRAVYRLSDDHVRTLLAQGLAHAEEDAR